MKPRAFRLASVLRVRERQLQAARGQLAAAVREQEHELRERRRLLSEADRSAGELYTRLAAGTTAALLPSVGLSGNRTSAAADAAEKSARMLDEKITAARAGLLEAKRSVRGLELLEQKSREREAAWHARRDARSLDEVAIRRRKESQA